MSGNLRLVVPSQSLVCQVRQSNSPRSGPPRANRAKGEQECQESQRDGEKQGSGYQGEREWHVTVSNSDSDAGRLPRSTLLTTRQWHIGDGTDLPGHLIRNHRTTCVRPSRHQALLLQFANFAGYHAAGIGTSVSFSSLWSAGTPAPRPSCGPGPKTGDLA